MQVYPGFPQLLCMASFKIRKALATSFCKETTAKISITPGVERVTAGSVCFPLSARPLLQDQLPPRLRRQLLPPALLPPRWQRTPVPLQTKCPAMSGKVPDTIPAMARGRCLSQSLRCFSRPGLDPVLAGTVRTPSASNLLANRCFCPGLLPPPTHCTFRGKVWVCSFCTV